MVRSTGWTVLLATAAGVLVAGLWLWMTDLTTGLGWGAVVVAPVIAVAVAVAVALRIAGDPGEPSEGGLWDHVPGWQYDGRHVESGGLTRAEQEDAIESVRDDAAETMEQLDDHE